MKKFFYITILLIMVILFAGCQKNSEVVEPDTSIKKVQSVPVISLSIPDNLCAGQMFSARVKIDQPASGVIKIMSSSDNGISWKKAAETKDCSTENDFYITLKKGKYKMMAQYESPAFPSVQTEETEIKVSDCLDCEEILLEPNLIGSDFLVSPGDLKTFTVEYSVTVCDQDYYGLKIQGGLIANAVYRSSYPEGAEVKQEDRNTIITWNIGDAEAGIEKTYSVTFEYVIPEASAGTHIPLTSGWIVKGKNSEEVPVTTGDYNEIYIQIQ
jgi:hypothetical protein